MQLHLIYVTDGRGLHSRSLSYQCLGPLQLGCSLLAPRAWLNLKRMSGPQRYALVVAAANALANQASDAVRALFWGRHPIYRYSISNNVVFLHHRDTP